MAYENLIVEDPELRQKINNPQVTVIRVTWIGDPNHKNWLVTKNDVGIPGHVYRTKQEAIKAGREVASRRENRPSVLVMEYKKEGGQKLKPGGGRAGARVSDWQYYRG